MMLTSFWFMLSILATLEENYKFPVQFQDIFL